MKLRCIEIRAFLEQGYHVNQLCPKSYYFMNTGSPGASSFESTKNIYENFLSNYFLNFLSWQVFCKDFEDKYRRQNFLETTKPPFPDILNHCNLYQHKCFATLLQSNSKREHETYIFTK